MHTAAKQNQGIKEVIPPSSPIHEKTIVREHAADRQTGRQAGTSHINHPNFFCLAEQVVHITIAMLALQVGR